MNLKQLQALIYVSRHGTFKKAAEALYFHSAGDEYITPESIQYRIKQLEQDLGVSLYQKRQGSSRVLLTREGQLFLREALEVYQRMCEWQSMFMETGSGVLTFASTQAVIIHRLLDAVKAFHEKQSSVRLRLFSATADEMEEMVNEGQVDFAFSTRRPERPELEYVLWKKSRMVVLMPAGHPLTKLRTVKLADIAQHPLVLLEQELRGDRDLVAEAFAHAGIDRLNIVMETSNSEIIAAYVEAGLGISIVAETTTLRQRRKVVSLPLEDIPERSEVGLLVRDGQYIPQRAKSFLQTLDPFFEKWLKERDDRIAKQVLDGQKKLEKETKTR